MKNVVSTITRKLNQVATIVACKTINGTSFVGVRNYTNKQGEVSNQTFLVGINFIKLLQNDLAKLKAFDIKPLFAEYDKEIVTKAYSELVTSLVKRTASEIEKEVLRANNDKTIAQSDRQHDLYTPLAKGLKTKVDENGVEFLYLSGLSVRKEVLEAIEYKPTKSQVKTIVKRKIEKLAELRIKKYRMFKLGRLEDLQIQGVTI